MSSATPLAEPENLDAYPAPPEGFSVARTNTPQGEVKIVEYDSKILGLRRLLRVYTPPGYSADRRYPVLYLHHGLGNTSTEWTQRARAAVIIDNLLADKKIEPFIIVFPSGNATAATGDEKQGDRTQASTARRTRMTSACLTSTGSPGSPRWPRYGRNEPQPVPFRAETLQGVGRAPICRRSEPGHEDGHLVESWSLRDARGSRLPGT